MSRMNDADNLQDTDEEAKNGRFSDRMRHQGSFQAGSPARQFESPPAVDQNNTELNLNQNSR